MPHGSSSLPAPDFPLSALPPMSLAPTHQQQHPITTIENNFAYPFRLRHSYGQQALHTPGRMFKGGDDFFCRPESSVACSDTSSPVSPYSDGDEDDGAVPRLPAAVYFHGPHRAEERFSHASGSTGTPSLNTRHRPSHSYGFGPNGPGSPSATDFPIIPSRPPLRPTVSFGGVSGISYYSTLSSEHEHELDARSLSLARAEQEGGAVGMRAKAASLTNVSLRKARSFACVWPEGRKKGR